MKETTLRQRFENLLLPKLREKNIPCWYYKIPDTLHLGGKKPFDAELLITGKFIAIEYKRAGKKPTPMQSYHLDMVKKSGGASLKIDETNYKKLAKRILFGAEITTKQIKSMNFRTQR